MEGKFGWKARLRRPRSPPVDKRGVVVGKREAAEWARSQRGASSVIADALARREGAAVQEPEEKARRLLEEVRERIREKAHLKT